MKHLRPLLLVFFLIFTFQLVACTSDKPPQDTTTNVSDTAEIADTAAENSPAQVIAQILINLNHFPSDEEKAMLKEITTSASASDAEKTIAGILINIQHSASDGDKAELKKVMEDASASKENQQLAEIVHNLNHKPSDEDKNTLQAIVK